MTLRHRLNEFHHSCIPFCPRCVHLPRVGLALVQCRLTAPLSNTNQGQNKASLRVPGEAVGIALREHKERRNAFAFSSARCRSRWNFLHFSRRLLCSYANCYGDEAVAPSYVRFTELLSCSFHCSVSGFEIISSLWCPGCWTYLSMKKRNTSFQDGSVTRPRESASFCR